MVRVKRERRMQMRVMALAKTKVSRVIGEAESVTPSS